MIVHPGSGGWGLFEYTADEVQVSGRVRFLVRDDGRLEATEIYLEAPAGIGSDVMRNVPIGSMEAWANGEGRLRFMKSIEEDGDAVNDATHHWMVATGGGAASLGEHLGEFVAEKMRNKSLRLRIPEGHRRPDNFYKQVADLYSELASKGSHRPAAQISVANGVPITTVHRWLREARARGLLAAGRRGKAG